MEKHFVVTAGHSRTDPGKVVGAWKESELATDLRDLTATALRDLGFTVREDGEDEGNQPLHDNSKPDALELAVANPGRAIEFHFNSGVATATGVEVFSLPQHKPLAKAVAASIAIALGLPMRGAGGWKDQKESPRKRLAYVNAGGLIVEVCFLTNPNDRRAYFANKKAVALAVAKAVNSTLRS